MVDEQVIQPESVTPAEQPVAETPTPQTPNLDGLKTEYEGKISALESKLAEADGRFQGIKGKLDDVYKKQDAQRKQELEDQGQWKTLWEEANKTAQDKDQVINDLRRENKEMKVSNETANLKTAALSAISDAGAINADQTLSLLQSNLKRSEDGKVVVLNGGVEQDLGTYIGNLKNPGSGWDHHFKASAAAGMGAKPTPTSNVSPGMPNPWKEGSINITRQMALESSEPELAAVLKREAQSG